MRLARQAERLAGQSASQATLGRYMVDMKHSMNNALTSLLGERAGKKYSRGADFLCEIRAY